MDTKQKLKHIEFTDTIKFWTWVNASKLAIITNSSVFHIDITKNQFFQTN